MHCNSIICDLKVKLCHIFCQQLAGLNQSGAEMSQMHNVCHLTEGHHLMRGSVNMVELELEKQQQKKNIGVAPPVLKADIWQHFCIM